MIPKREKIEGAGRKNSGRNPVADKKVNVSIYPAQSRVDLLGKDKIQEVALDAVEKEFKKASKESLK